MATELTIRLPDLDKHTKQREFIRSKAKRKVIVAGRRGGKTTGVSVLATERFLAGRRQLYAAPTQEQTNAFWKAVTTYLAAPIASKHIYKNETDHILELPTGARIRAKTAWNADTLRGDYADDLYLEEWSLMDESAWNEVGAPMLLDNDGDAVFIFTPKRRNHAWKTYQRAKQAEEDGTGRWKTWHFTSFDNPHLSPEALAEITQDMTEDAYQQEILAEFLEDSGTVFRNVMAVAKVKERDVPENHLGHHVAIGADWGKVADPTVFTAQCSECRRVVDWDLFKQVDYHVQRQHLKALTEKWFGAPVLPERNSIGIPNIEELAREGITILSGEDGAAGFNTTQASKARMIEGLALDIERGQVLVPESYADELMSFERLGVSPNGLPRYGAPEGMHDDRVISLGLSNLASNMGFVTSGVIHNEEYTIFDG